MKAGACPGQGRPVPRGRLFLGRFAGDEFLHEWTNLLFGGGQKGTAEGDIHDFLFCGVLKARGP